MSRYFPSIAVGRCAKCGRRASDSETGTSADVSARFTSDRDLNLKYFRGEWWCEICITDELSDEHSERVADRCRREEEFRSSAGFTKTIE